MAVSVEPVTPPVPETLEDSVPANSISQQRRQNKDTLPVPDQAWPSPLTPSTRSKRSPHTTRTSPCRTLPVINTSPPPCTMAHQCKAKLRVRLRCLEPDRSATRSTRSEKNTLKRCPEHNGALEVAIASRESKAAEGTTQHLAPLGFEARCTKLQTDIGKMCMRRSVKRGPWYGLVSLSFLFCSWQLPSDGQVFLVTWSQSFSLKVMMLME